MGDEWRQRVWYRETDRWLALAERYLVAARGAAQGLAEAEIRNYEQHQLARLVFESNRIEHAGLSEGETRRLITEAAFEPAIDLFDDEGVSVYRYRDRHALRLGARPLGELQVLRHMLAFNRARLWAQQDRTEPRGAARRFAPDLVAELHQNLAEGLLDDDAGVPAGAYRTDRRMVVDANLILPAPELVPASMDRFCARAAARLEADDDACLAAADVSYEFVAIHPFPDFNGRLSRLLLNMVLWRRGLPFPIALKGDAKGKQRYFRSLRLANAGDIKPYAALIAKHLVEACEAIDANLERAGLPTLRSTFDEAQAT